MSNKLMQFWGTRIRVTATFTGCGKRGRTLRFDNVTCCKTGELLRNHTWILADQFGFQMRIGDEVSFVAHVYSYESKWGDLVRLSFGLGSCREFVCESRDNNVIPWNGGHRREELEVAA